MSTEGQQGVSPAAGAPAGVRSIAPYRRASWGWIRPAS